MHKFMLAAMVAMSLALAPAVQAYSTTDRSAVCDTKCDGKKDKDGKESKSSSCDTKCGDKKKDKDKEKKD